MAQIMIDGTVHEVAPAVALAYGTLKCLVAQFEQGIGAGPAEWQVLRNRLNLSKRQLLAMSQAGDVKDAALQECIEALVPYATDEEPEGWTPIAAITKARAAIARKPEYGQPLRLPEEVDSPDKDLLEAAAALCPGVSFEEASARLFQLGHQAEANACRRMAMIQDVTPIAELLEGEQRRLAGEPEIRVLSLANLERCQLI